MKMLYMELDPVDALMIANALDMSATIVGSGICRLGGISEEEVTAQEVVEELRQMKNRILSLLKEATK